MSTVEDLRKRFEALGDDEDVAMKQLILEVSSSIHIHTIMMEQWSYHAWVDKYLGSR